MDRPEPQEPPSIFSRPDPELDDLALRQRSMPPEPSPTDGSTWSPPSNPSMPSEPSSPRRPIPDEPERRRPSTRVLITIGSGGALLVAIIGFVGALALRPADAPALAGASPSAAPSASASVEPDPSVESSATAAASPTVAPAASTPAASTPAPVAAPAGPPQEIASGGWASVSVSELNVRRDPGVASTSIHRLAQGAVVHVGSEDPVVLDGFAWYRVASLDGAEGWAASGPDAAPFLETLVADGYLIHCGQVDGPILDVVGGRIEAVDPVRIGGLSVSAARFTDVEMGIFELVWSIRGEACFGALVGADGSLGVYVDTAVWACGRPEVADGIRRMLPDPEVDATVEIRVKEAGIVHPALLTTVLGDDRATRNMQGTFALTAANAGVTGCVEGRVTHRPGSGVEHYRYVNAVQCIVADSWDGTEAVVRPGSGGPSFTLYPSSVDAEIVIGQPMGWNVDAGEDSRSGSGAGFTSHPGVDCG